MIDSAQVDRFFKLAIYYPVEILVLLAALALLAGFRVKPAIAWTVGLAAVVAIVVRTMDRYPEGFDLELFWAAGRVVLRGEDPYLTDVRILNPPTALPLFALLALTDFVTLLHIWTVANVVACCGLGLLAVAALTAQGEKAPWQLPPSAIAVLAGVLAFCYACRRGLDAGQLSVLAIVPIFAALWAQGRGKPLLAGALLAVASIKAATWLPFLLLFLRKRDWPSWVAMGAVGLGLSLLATPPGELAQRCRECLNNIATLSQIGRVNDVDHANTQSVDLVTLERALYCAGLEDRAVMKAITLAVTISIGVWLAWSIVKGNHSRPAACSLIAFYAALFLYHRQYDMVVLALPLVYVTGRAQQAQGAPRWLYALSGVAILAVLYFRLPELEALRLRILAGQVHPVMEAVVMPYCTWCVLLGLVSLALAECGSRAQTAEVLGLQPELGLGR